MYLLMQLSKFGLLIESTLSIYLNVRFIDLPPVFHLTFTSIFFVVVKAMPQVMENIVKDRRTMFSWGC
jgi:hypothetical protein